MAEISDKEYQELQDARELAESTIRAVREPLLVLDSDLKVASASPAFLRTFKVKAEETEKRFIYELGDKQWDIPKLRELLERLLPNKESIDDFEVEHDFTGIGKRIMLLNARRIPRPPAKPRMILLSFEDVTERMGQEVAESKRVGALISDSENKYKIIFDCAPDAYYLSDLKGNLIDGNKAAEKLTGYAKEELIGKSFLNLGLLSMDQVPKAAGLLARNLLGQATGQDEFTLSRKDGSRVAAEISTYPTTIHGQGVVLGIARDITERKQMTDELANKVKELEKLAWIMEGREDRILELKREIKKLKGL